MFIDKNDKKPRITKEELSQYQEIWAGISYWKGLDFEKYLEYWHESLDFLVMVRTKYGYKSDDMILIIMDTGDILCANV